MKISRNIVFLSMVLNLRVQLIMFVQDEVRVSRKDFKTERAKMYGPQDMWHHVDCFVENRNDIGFGTDMQPSK